MILAALLLSTSAWAQYSNKAGNVVGTAGGACDSTIIDYAWPDANGYILKCVSNLWTVVNIPAAAAGSTGYVQFNSGGALAGDSSFFWDNTNKRLGIGTTSPASALQLGSGQIEVPTGSLSAPPYSFTSATGTGMYYGGGANGVAFSTGGTLVGYFNGSNALILPAGSLGLQTNAGTIDFGASADAHLSRPSAATLHLGAADAAAPVAQTLGVQNVVAGTTNTAGADFTITGSKGTGTGAGGKVIFQAAPAGSTGTAQNALATAMTIASSGNVGIGTTVPANKLHVYAGSSSLTPYSLSPLIVESNATNYISVLGGTGNNTGILFGAANTSALEGRLVYSNTNREMQFWTANAQKMVLDTSGNVGIGTTVPSNKLDVNGAASIGYVNTAAPSSGLIVSGNVGIGTSTPVAMLHVGSASAVGVIADLQNTAGYCTLNPSSSSLISTCTSDIRLKTNIRDAGDVLGWIASLRLREFTLKATGERRMGVIAQEVQTTHPEMVSMGGNGFYQVEVPDAWKLVKAIQELKAENDAERAQIEALRAEVSELRKQMHTP